MEQITKKSYEETQNGVSIFDVIPDEVLMMILNYFYSSLSCSLVCRKWSTILKELRESYKMMIRDSIDPVALFLTLMDGVTNLHYESASPSSGMFMIYRILDTVNVDNIKKVELYFLIRNDKIGKFESFYDGTLTFTTIAQILEEVDIAYPDFQIQEDIINAKKVLVCNIMEKSGFFPTELKCLRLSVIKKFIAYCNDNVTIKDLIALKKSSERYNASCDFPSYTHGPQ